ncbi:MAG: hypothetical protein HQL37_04190, partial [Alphaproteobacteria bacterium]|nr:hypothetical protein [Alphaproteobacteria bacterium]
GVDKEALYWESIKDSNNSAFYQAYLDQFPSGVFAGLARAKLAAIPTSRTASLPSPPPPATPTAPVVVKPVVAPRALDPASVPYLSESQKASLGGYLAAASPKALVIGSAGHFAWVSKGNTDSTREDVQRRALERCQFSNRTPCVLYSVDGLLVGANGAVPPPTPVTLRMSGVFVAADVPFVSQTARDTKMLEYAGASPHKALAIHISGAWTYVSKRNTVEEAKTDALERCAKLRNQGCLIYAADDEVVLNGRETSNDGVGAKAGRGKGIGVRVIEEDQ